MSENEHKISWGSWGSKVNYKCPQVTVWLVGQTYGRCWYCGENFYEHPHEFTVDHVVPMSRGGKHVLRNLLPCCKTCNRQKKSKTYDEYRKYLTEKTGKELFWCEERIAKRKVNVGRVATAEISEYKKLRGISR